MQCCLQITDHNYHNAVYIYIRDITTITEGLNRFCQHQALCPISFSFLLTGLGLSWGFHNVDQNASNILNNFCQITDCYFYSIILLFHYGSSPSIFNDYIYIYVMVLKQYYPSGCKCAPTPHFTKEFIPDMHQLLCWNISVGLTKKKNLKINSQQMPSIYIKIIISFSRAYLLLSNFEPSA